jgi:hypothetical protein
MAYGTWRNPVDDGAIARGPRVRDRRARVLMWIGIVLVVISFVLRFFAE